MKKRSSNVYIYYETHQILKLIKARAKTKSESKPFIIIDFIDEAVNEKLKREGYNSKGEKE